MKKILAFIFLVSLISFSQVQFVLADSSTSTKNQALDQLHSSAKGAGLPEESKDPRILASEIVKAFLGLVGTIAIFLFVYSGYLLVTSHGDSDKVGKASKIMTGAVIGILLILLSFSITNFIGNRIQKEINQTK